MGTVLKPWPETKKLRRWQRRALQQWIFDNKRDFLLVATPGAGKTRYALWGAHYLISSGRVARLVVVCPTENIKQQWASTANEVGLFIDANWSNSFGRETEDYHGIVTTYQGVSKAPALFKKQCEDRPTLVILDELHHCAANLCWGEAAGEAFAPAEYRLSLSGTMFRNDNCQIVFCQYDGDGRSVPDFSYSYAEALKDNVCRPVYFPTINGRAKWISHDGALLDCWLLDAVEHRYESERLRTILSTNGEWLPAVLRAANDKLSEVRASGHPDAGGLIFAIDQQHASNVAALLRRISGVEPVKATSSDADAQQKIQQFAAGTDRFLVCVRMVWEGSDIPRARVGVYGSNVMSELALRQAVGRFVRMQPDLEDQSATLFIPAVEPLITYARRIKIERDHVLREAVGADIDFGRELPAKGGEDDELPQSKFHPIAASAVPHDTIFDGEAYNPEELVYADRLRRIAGVQVPPAQIAALLRRFTADMGQSHGEVAERTASTSLTLGVRKPPAMPPADRISTTAAEILKQLDQSQPLHLRKKQLRSMAQRAAAKLGGMTGSRPFVMHQQWVEMGGMRQNEATEDDLKRKLVYFWNRISEIDLKRRESRSQHA
jgi:superfamily II DNA or RNA helicase